MNQDTRLPSRGALESLREYDTPLIANTLDYIDNTPAHELYMGGDIQCLIPGLGPMVGIAVTCQMDSSTPGGRPELDLYWRQVEEMAAVDRPLVWVVETIGSRPEHECVLGDGAAKTLMAAGCVGAVTSGRVRDVTGLRSIRFPVYCRGTVAHHCAVRVKKINIPVSIGGIVVAPGDIIHASEEGVIRVPAEALEELLARTPAHRAVEHQVHAIWRRADISVREKQRRATEIYRAHGFVRPGGLPDTP